MKKNKLGSVAEFMWAVTRGTQIEPAWETRRGRTAAWKGNCEMTKRARQEEEQQQKQGKIQEQEQEEQQQKQQQKQQ
eukprot:3053095-Rhodomonas_salina.1